MLILCRGSGNTESVNEQNPVWIMSYQGHDFNSSFYQKPAVLLYSGTLSGTDANTSTNGELLFYQHESAVASGTDHEMALGQNSNKCAQGSWRRGKLKVSEPRQIPDYSTIRTFNTLTAVEGDISGKADLKELRFNFTCLCKESTRTRKVWPGQLLASTGRWNQSSMLTSSRPVWLILGTGSVYLNDGEVRPY